MQSRLSFPVSYALTLVQPHSPDLAQAYRDQHSLAKRGGGRQTGWKIAATNVAAQAKRGVTEPMYGRLFAERTRLAPDSIRAPAMETLFLEVEFAFRMARGLARSRTGGVHDSASICACIGEMFLAVELVGSPPDDWLTCAAAPLVAANVAHVGLVLGPAVPAWRDIDLAAVRTTLRLDGIERACGSGAAVLSNPLEAVAWLANRLLADGEELLAGQLVLSGTTIAPVPVGQALRAQAVFEGLGHLFIQLRD